MNYRISELEKDNTNINDLRYIYNKIKKTYEGVANLVYTYETNEKNEFVQQQIEEGEKTLRWNVRIFFENYTKHLVHSGKYKKVKTETICKYFPSLTKVYPQVEFDKKKILLMTIHKAMYGIDPIISDRINISNLSKKGKKTLILFDESDQAAIAMRNAIIDQSIEETGGTKKYEKGYNGFLQYKTLLENPGHIATEDYGEEIESCIALEISEVSTSIVKFPCWVV